MAGFRWAVVFALVLSVAGCGSEEDTGTAAPTKTTDSDTAMPDVLGKRLDVALSDIKRSGLENDVEVVGGGTFGVVDESNWTVCEQSPAAGELVTEAPRLEVDRSCDDGAPDPTEPSTDSAPTPTDQPSDEPTQEPTEPEPAEPDAETILTAENNGDLAALLVGPGECDESVAAFATKYGGQTIQFDGNIADMANHDSYDTRYDFLIYTGDYNGEVGNPGPSFQFQDVAFFDLKFPASGAPGSVSVGDSLRFTAKVKEFTTGCLLELEPVATETR